MSVTPTAGADTIPADGSLDSVAFTVRNTGSQYIDTYYLTKSCSGVSCPKGSNPNPAGPLILSPGYSNTVYVKFYHPSVGTTGTVALQAADTSGYQSTGSYGIVSVAVTLTMVVPVANGANGRAFARSRRPLVLATYSSFPYAVDSTSVDLQIRGYHVTSLARHNRTILEWEVDSANQLTPGDSADIYVRVCDVRSNCAAVNRRTYLDNTGPPIMTFTGMPLEALGRQAVAPFGPGIAVSGAEIETGFAVPSYVSMSAARSTGLVYSTRTSHPRALVNADIELTWPAGTPDQMKAVLIDGSVRMDSVVASSPSCTAAAGRLCRIGLQGDYAASTFPTPTRKWLKVETTVTSAGVNKVSTDSVEVVLVDRRASRYGDGWGVAGVLQLVAAGSDQLLVAPNGQVTVYRGSGGYYLSPPGDYSVLAYTGSQYQLQFRDGSTIAFNSSGWESQATDANGNTTTVGYSGAGQVTSITDPTSHAFTYAYDGNGKLSTITDPGNRVTQVTINGSTNYLTEDSLASSTPTPLVATYAYTSTGGNGAVVLASRSDALGHATTVSYDSRNRPTQATLPAVLPDTGSTAQSPVIPYVPQDTKALGAVVPADNVYAMVRDPLFHWAKASLNRWGAPVVTWDSLGTTSRASYTPEGFVAWAEGKVPDSTRVYSTYDTLGHLVRTYRWRAANHMVRLDSLYYDANHNVVQRIDARGKVSRFGYDAHHNLLWAATPTNDTSWTRYTANGQPDSTRAPGQSVWNVIVYDGTWKNVQTVTQQNVTLAINILDSWGRTVQAQRRIVAQQSGSTTWYQWRQTVTGFDAANLADTITSERSDNCTPCANPPGWPSPSDTLKYRQVRLVRTRLGLDSLRYDPRGNVTLYAYDALGRLRLRQPPGSGRLPADSFRYDLAGNLRYQWTRRGYQLTHYYDNRSRDTMTTVPGVGDYRRTYTGPNDELTRFWINNYTDSIGGVNPEVRWGYSQAGFLLADTAQGSRVTAYQRDTLGRDSVVTDVVGSWALKYETQRGMVDTLISPWADTLAYTFSSRFLVSGPSIRSGSNALMARTQWYTLDNKLRELLNEAGSYTAGDLSGDDLNPDTELLPLWTEQQGSGGPTVTAQDTLTTDGWLRLAQARYYKNGALLAADTFSFDLTGNISRSGESRTYDATTDRLTARAGDAYYYAAAGQLALWDPAGGGEWSYGYDALERLVSVRWCGTLVARYAYDVLGRRIARRVYSGGALGADTAFVRMIYRGNQVTAEADSGGSLTLSYTWGLEMDDLEAIHRHSDGAHWYTVQDALHSVRGLVSRDGSGTWRASWRYRAYGLLLDNAGTAPVTLRYRWIGREYDPETGFYYVRARYYDPTAARFIQEDPSGYATSSNLYAYGDGNPTNGRDLDGLVKEPTAYEPPPVINWGIGTVYDPFVIGGCVSLQGGSCSAGWSAEQEAWAGSMITGWDRLTTFEQDAAYESYLRMARVMIAANVAVAVASGYQLRQDLRPLLFPEYQRAIAALNQEVSGEAELAIIIGTVNQGRIVAATSLRFDAITLLGNPGEALFGTRLALGYVAPGLFADGVPFWYVAHVIVHEYEHIWGMSHGQGMCNAIYGLVPNSQYGFSSHTPPLNPGCM